MRSIATVSGEKKLAVKEFKRNISGGSVKSAKYHPIQTTKKQTIAISITANQLEKAAESVLDFASRIVEICTRITVLPGPKYPTNTLPIHHF
jgi:hypothetical protein